MHAFRDTGQRSWLIEINVGAAKRARDLAGVSLYKLAEDRFQPLADLLADPVRFVDCLWCCVRPEDGQPATDEDFGRALGGDALEAAAEAFVGELIDFFPAAQRKALAKIHQTLKLGKAKLETRTAARIEAFDPEKESDRIVQRLLDESTETPSNEPPGSAPPSPESPLGASPSPS